MGASKFDNVRDSNRSHKLMMKPEFGAMSQFGGPMTTYSGTGFRYTKTSQPSNPLFQ